MLATLLQEAALKPYDQRQSTDLYQLCLGLVAESKELNVDQCRFQECQACIREADMLFAIIRIGVVLPESKDAELIDQLVRSQHELLINRSNLQDKLAINESDLLLNYAELWERIKELQT